MVTCFFIPPMGHTKEFYNWVKHNNTIFLEYPYDKKVKDSDDAIEYLAQYFAKLIIESGEENYVLVGVSLGATLSLRINEILDNKAKSIIMMAPGGLRVARARKEMINHAIINMPQDEFISKALALESEQSFLDHFSLDTQRALAYYPIIKSFWSTKYHSTQGDAFKKMAIDALNVNFEHLLDEYQEKIFLLWGQDDKIFSMRHFRKFKKTIPNSHIELFADVGHYLPIEAPQYLDKIVDNYVFNI